MPPQIDLLLTYLRSLYDNPSGQEWIDLYTRTQVELLLKSQEIAPEKSEEPTTQSRTNEQEQQREHFEVLDGLRKAIREKPYNSLLVGKPGFGKSTALLRLLWEEAQQSLLIAENGQENFTIPVLIELRDCRSGSVEEWIQKKLRRVRIGEEALQKLLLDGRFLLLFDGFNGGTIVLLITN